ncbi:MAG: hypothetical protein Q9168_004302 [Polycauliona sp. 1 TL-2023]
MEVKGDACGLRPKQPPDNDLHQTQHLIKSIEIADGWEFRQAGDEPASSPGWLPVSRFPTDIYTDLAYHHLVPDPSVAKNEEHVQWVGEQSWVYRTKFVSPPLTSAQTATIAFDGLDTYATVSLNGKEVLKTKNMFIPERLDVTKHLNTSSESKLEIVFESSYLVGKKLVESDPGHGYGCWNAFILIDNSFVLGDPSRLTIRKASYHYCEVDGNATEVRFEVLFKGKMVAIETVEIVGGLASAVFRTQKPELWFPARYGKQPLYDLKAVLYAGTSVCDVKTKRFGLRRAEVIQRELEDAPGTTLFFQVNNIPVFCGGSNWIPVDMSIPRIDPSKYRALVKLALEGNNSMIRVWGGGIYEEDVFYDTCDEFGVLVWQDFLFACGNYPANDEFLDLVKREATANVKRLRHHPCIVIWAGNNEDYQYRESENLEYDPDDRKPENWLKTNFPARYIYEKLLVDVTRELIPDTYYHFGSPFGGGGKSTTDPTVGDIHQWNVWHGTQESYQNWDKLGGRFVSEFGMEAFPSSTTVDSYLPNGKDDPDRYAQSSTIDFHNKAVGHERRIAAYLVENIPYSHEPFDYYVYCTQLMQAECIATAFRLWKREWKGPSREYCGGALVWQLNDCWPGQSWSIVDYFLQPKLAYYTMKRELVDITINTKRIVEEIPADKYTRAHIQNIHKVQIFATNLSMDDHHYALRYKGWDIRTGEHQFTRQIPKPGMLKHNRSTELDVHILGDSERAARMIIAAYLVDLGNDRIIARSISWPEPLKYIRFPVPKNLRIDIIGDQDTGKVIEIQSDVLVKGFVLEVNNGNEKGTIVSLDDNCVDLVPGEPIRIGVKGLEAIQEPKIRYRHLKAAIDL